LTSFDPALSLKKCVGGKNSGEKEAKATVE